jgi:microcystin degradation protein MlrC
MRLAVAGFMHESNTFNPLRTDRAAFVAQSLTFGPALVAEWRDAHHEVGGFLEAADVEGFTAIPLVMAWATPSGPVADAFVDEVTTYLIDQLRKERPDGLLLALHGAMVAESHLDGDGEVLARLRSALGRDFPIGVTLDLHGNISERLAASCDFAVAYRTNPHVDQRECGRRAARLMVRRARGELQPTMAIARPPLIVNIMAHDTSTEPLRSFMEQARAMESRPGILAVSILPGFAYADVPQMGPAVLVVTDNDQALARCEADRLAAELWTRRAARPSIHGASSIDTFAGRCTRWSDDRQGQHHLSGANAQTYTRRTPHLPSRESAHALSRLPRRPCRRVFSNCDPRCRCAEEERHPAHRRRHGSRPRLLR